jgi:hypothetical protein
MAGLCEIGYMELWRRETGRERPHTGEALAGFVRLSTAALRFVVRRNAWTGDPFARLSHSFTQCAWLIRADTKTTESTKDISKGG